MTSTCGIRVSRFTLAVVIGIGFNRLTHLPPVSDPPLFVGQSSGFAKKTHTCVNPLLCFGVLPKGLWVRRKAPESLADFHRIRDSQY